MRIMALDTSMTATGVAVIDVDPKTFLLEGIRHHATIRPPRRRKNEGDGSWNVSRYRDFYFNMEDIHEEYHPDIIVTEVMEHAYVVVRDAQGRQKKSSKGIEYRAGYGLGRAMGWLDGWVSGRDGSYPNGYEQMSVESIKLRIAGAAGASKAAVKDGLKTYFGLSTDGYTEAEVDALAVGVAWAREREHEVRMFGAKYEGVL